MFRSVYLNKADKIYLKKMLVAYTLLAVGPKLPSWKAASIAHKLILVSYIRN
jgi:hypothetical protein